MARSKNGVRVADTGVTIGFCEESRAPLIRDEQRHGSACACRGSAARGGRDGPAIVIPRGAGRSRSSMADPCVLLHGAQLRELRTGHPFPHPGVVPRRTVGRSSTVLWSFSRRSLRGAAPLFANRPGEHAAPEGFGRSRAAIATVAPRACEGTQSAPTPKHADDANSAEEPLIANGWGGDAIGGSVVDRIARRDDGLGQARRSPTAEFEPSDRPDSTTAHSSRTCRRRRNRRRLDGRIARRGRRATRGLS